MLSLDTYKLIHFAGILMVFVAVGGLLIYSSKGGGDTQNWRKRLNVTHGVGLLLLLLGGFGMQARLELPFPWPGWFWLKLLIWLAFGGLLAIMPRKPEMGKALWWLVIALGAFAALMGITKPF